MRNKIAAIVLVTVVICIGLFIVVDSALVEASATAARAPEEEWSRTFGGSDWDEAYSVQQTTDGCYILAGETFSYGAGCSDLWLVKTDSAGNEEWSWTFGGSYWDVAYSVQQTADGGYILAGRTNSYGAGSNNFWLVKTNSAGNEEWNRTFGRYGAGEAHSVQQTTDGGYILAGTMNFYDACSADFWLVKTNSAGNEEWNRTFGGSDWDEAESVQQTADGGYILAGTMDLYDAGSADFWLVKTDSTGKEEWNRTFGGSDDDKAHSVRETSDGGYIIAGIIAGETESYGSGKADFWLIKLEGTAEKAMKAEILSPSSDFSVLKDSNVPLKVYVTYEGEPTTGASLTASFSNGDPDVKLTEGENGIYTGTWTPTNIIEGQVESPVEITVEAYHGILGRVYAKVNGVIKTEIPLNIEDFGITPPTRNFPANGPITTGINDKIGIWYSIKSTDTSNKDVKLITKIRSQDTGEIIPDPTNDKVVTLSPSDTRWYSPKFQTLYTPPPAHP